MHETDHRYQLTAQADGELIITIGHGFTDGDVAELVAVANAARAALGGER